MDITQKRHSLIASHTDAPDTYTIDLRDVYYFEKAQIQKNSTYDETLANELFDRLEDAVFRKAKPIFTPIDGGFVSDKHRLMDECYGKAYLKLRERIALNYFCRVNNCYSFDNQVTIGKSHEEYTYWFSFKLRQYDLYLKKTASFLSFQLKKNFNKNLDQFLEILDLSLDQYPELFSDRLRKTVQRWMAEKRKPTEQTPESSKVAQTSNKIKTAKEDQSLIDAQTYNELENAKPSKNIDVGQIVKAKKSKKKIVKTQSKFKWIETAKTDKQLEYLRNALINNDFIDDIKLEKFKNNFNGKLNEKTKINWLKERFALIHLLNGLKDYLEPEIYTLIDGTISIASFAPHFLENGKEINVRNWTSAKSRMNDIKEKYERESSFISINLIINDLKTLP